MFYRPSRTLVVLMAAALVAAPFLDGGETEAADPFLGTIETFGFGFAPRNWAFCDGQLLPISAYSALYSLLGTTYGGDGRTTFGLPDLRGRVPLHPGHGPGLSTVVWGERGGVEVRTLTVANMPSHNHAATLHATSTDGNEEGPAGHILAGDPREDQYSNATPNVTMYAGCITMTNAGSSQAFSVRNPYLGVYHCISLSGLYPSRP